MPADRFLHKRAGQGERTGELSHLEWRVWTVYLIAADDFGVMWAHESMLHSASPGLISETPRKLRAALEKLVNSKLLGRFTHQSRHYLYQRDWQEWQKVKFPSETELPKIPDEMLDGCSDGTKRLVSAWPGGRPVPSKEEWQHFQSTSEVAGEELPQSLTKNFPNTSPSCARAPAGANGSGSGYGYGSSEIPDDLQSVGEFIDGYRERYRKVTGGSLPLVNSPKDLGIATRMLKTWPKDRLLDMAEIFFHRSDRQVEGKPKTLAFFEPMAPWCDAQMAGVGR